MNKGTVTHEGNVTRAELTGFMLELELGQTPETTLIKNSRSWNFLREALNNLEVNQWLKIPVTITDPERISDITYIFDRVRAATYGWAGAAKLKENNLEILTFSRKVDDDPKKGVVWVIIQPKGTVASVRKMVTETYAVPKVLENITA